MINDIKKQFPLFNTHPDLVYLDSAATTQTPQSVLDAMNEYYTSYRANIHHGVYGISEQASAAYEKTRTIVADFLGVDDSSQIIFTRGTTESINLVARGWADMHLKAGDEILVSEMEHHANFVPWYEVCKRTGANLRIIPLKDDLHLDIDAYSAMLSEKTKLVCVSAISNVTGTVNDIQTITRLAHQRGAKVLIDGAQAVSHQVCNLEQWDVDFFAFSGHKMYGPTGVGVLYGKRDLLESMNPLLYGGGMVVKVSAEQVSYKDIPTRFEGGTPPIAEVIGLGAAVQFLEAIGMDTIAAYEHDLVQYAHRALSDIEGLTVFHPMDGAGMAAFTMEGIHPHDIASIADSHGIAIRAGHHCTQPLHQRLGVLATARMSIGIYNIKEDIDALVSTLVQAKQKFA
ncbi:MAG: SufS family cysteine desulfurase [Patescibacteria group bacterium]